MFLGNFTGSYEMTVDIDGDNAGMSRGYLIQYALLPCPSSYPEIPPTLPGGAATSCIMGLTGDDYIESPEYPYPAPSGHWRHFIQKRNSDICQIKY